MTFSILTTFIGRNYTTVVGMDIPTKLVGTVYFDKSCEEECMANPLLLVVFGPLSVKLSFFD